MAKEQERHPTDPPLVDPREFLAKPFERLEVGELPKPPDIDFLRWLTTLEEETGLVCRGSSWFVIKCSKLGVPSWLMPKDSEILLHSHPSGETMGESDDSIPSVKDYFNCSSTAKNLVISHKGITQYWPVPPENQIFLQLWIERNEDSRKVPTQEEHLAFLERRGAKFTVHAWKELDQEKLAKLLACPELLSKNDKA